MYSTVAHAHLHVISVTPLASAKKKKKNPNQLVAVDFISFPALVNRASVFFSSH